MESAGSPRRDKMEEIGERILNKHMTLEKTQTETSIFSPTDKLIQIVIELSRILKSIDGNPTQQQLEKVELLANSLTRQLQNLGKVPNPEVGENSKLFESYKILSCSLLLIQKYQNYRALLKKYDELQKESELNKRIFQKEIDAYKSNESISFRALASNTQSCAEQINQVQKETQTIQLQFSEYKNSANRIFSSVIKLLKLPEGTSMKDLQNELDSKVRNQQSSFISDKEYDSLVTEIQNLSTQNLSFQVQNKQVSDELKNLKESIFDKDKQILSLTQENELLQNKVKDLLLQQQEQPNNISFSHASESDRSDIFLLQTDLNTSKINLESSQKKILRLKAKLKKARDELCESKDENSKCKEQLERVQLELHKLQLENDNSKSSADSADGYDVRSEISAKEAELEKMKTTLEEVTEKFQMQSIELSQAQKIKDNIVCCLQKQSSLISELMKAAGEFERDAQIKKVEKDDAVALFQKSEKENEKLKTFVTGVAQIIASNASPKLTSTVSNMVESLNIDTFREFYYSNLNQPNDGVTPENSRELIDRLFGYLEDQIEILQSVSNSSTVPDSPTNAAILKSCAKANKFVSDHYSSMYSSPSIFHSFGLVVDPAELTNSVKKFVQTFQNDNDVKSRELLVISKEAIAMNSLLRNIASHLRKDNQKLTADLKKSKEEIQKVIKIEDEAKKRLESMEQRFNESISVQKESMQKNQNILDSLKSLLANGSLHLPKRLSKAIKEKEPPFNSPLSETEIESFSMQMKAKKKEQQIAQSRSKEFEELQAKLDKMRKVKKALKNKVNFLVKQHEDEKAKLMEELDSSKNEIDSLIKQKEEMEEENSKLVKDHEQNLSSLNDDCCRKLAEVQKSVNKEVELNIDRVRLDFQSELKSVKSELKSKVRKAESAAQSQMERADNLKNHYEALLESARVKLNAARKSEAELREELSKLECENSQLKSKQSRMKIDNKMLSIQLSSLNSDGNADGSVMNTANFAASSYFSSPSSPSSRNDDLVLTRMKQVAIISQLEEKVETAERKSRDFLVAVREMFRGFTILGDEILTFESAKKVLKKAADEIAKMKEDSGRFSEAVDELNRIKSVVSPNPGVSTAFAVSIKIEQMQKEIQKLRKQI